MPEFVHFGDFEIANIGGYLCTRTQKLYEVKAIPAEAWHGKYGLYLSLPYSGEPEEKIKKMMIWTPSRYVVCLLNGDESGVYWKMRVFEDYTLLVMDDQGNYYHVKRSTRSRRVVEPWRKKQGVVDRRDFRLYLPPPSGTVQAGICGIAELDRHLGRGAVNPPLNSVFGASILLWSHVDMLPEIFIEEGKVGKS